MEQTKFRYKLKKFRQITEKLEEVEEWFGSAQIKTVQAVEIDLPVANATIVELGQKMIISRFYLPPRYKTFFSGTKELESHAEKFTILS